MKDFIPEGEDSGSPTGVGGYRDFVPQEEIDAKKEKNRIVKEEKTKKVEEEPEVKRPVRGKKHNLK